MSKVFKIVLVTFLPLVFISSTLTEKKINEKEAAAIFKKIADWFKDTDKFTVNTEFKTFKSHETITPYETLTGFVKKQGRLFHSYLMGIHTIQNEKYQLMIDTTNKIISVPLLDNAAIEYQYEADDQSDSIVISAKLVIT